MGLRRVALAVVSRAARLLSSPLLPILRHLLVIACLEVIRGEMTLSRDQLGATPAGGGLQAIMTLAVWGGHQGYNSALISRVFETVAIMASYWPALQYERWHHYLQQAAGETCHALQAQLSCTCWQLPRPAFQGLFSQQFSPTAPHCLRCKLALHVDYGGLAGEAAGRPVGARSPFCSLGGLPDGHKAGRVAVRVTGC